MIAALMTELMTEAYWRDPWKEKGLVGTLHEAGEVMAALGLTLELRVRGEQLATYVRNPRTEREYSITIGPPWYDEQAVVSAVRKTVAGILYEHAEAS